MDSRKLILKQTGIVSAGMLIMSGIMLLVFWGLDKFSLPVLWGAVAGCAIVIVNFFFMSVTVSLAADKAQSGDPQQGQKMIQLSSTVRLVCMGIAMVLCIKLGANVLSLVLPLAFLRPVIMITEFFGKKGD